MTQTKKPLIRKGRKALLPRFHPYWRGIPAHFIGPEKGSCSKAPFTGFAAGLALTPTRCAVPDSAALPVKPVMALWGTKYKSSVTLLYHRSKIT